MSIQVATKTWQVAPNLLSPAEATELIAAQKCLFNIINALETFATKLPVVGSCKSTSYNMSGTNLIAAYTDLVWNTPGSAHSWILYGFAGGKQVLLDCRYTAANCEDLFVGWSPGGLYTGGSTTAAPTATDEQTTGPFFSATVSDVWWTGYMAGAQPDVRQNVWLSTDLTGMRVAIYKTAKCCAYWYIGEIADCKSVQTGTFYVGAIGTPTTLVDCLTASWVQDAPWLIGVKTPAAAVPHSARLLCYGSGTGPFFESSDASVLDEFSGVPDALPIVIASSTVGARGLRGTLIDAWWNANVQVVSLGDTQPNNASARAFVMLGNLILPWTGNSTQLLSS